MSPATQAPLPAMSVTVRTSDNPDTVAQAAATTVHTFDPNQPQPRAVAMEAFLDEGMGDRRFVGLLLGLFDSLALMLAVVGILGVVSYMVEQRTHEIALRMALGAKRADVLRMIVFGQTGKLAVIGVAAGIAGAMATTRLLASQLYGVTPYDPLTFVVASLVLVAAALLASYFPARRATVVNPVTALRCE